MGVESDGTLSLIRASDLLPSPLRSLNVTRGALSVDCRAGNLSVLCGICRAQNEDAKRSRHLPALTLVSYIHQSEVYDSLERSARDKESMSWR